MRAFQQIFQGLIAAMLVTFLSLSGLTPAAWAKPDKRAKFKPFELLQGEILPTGVRITPAAAPGSNFQLLNPELPSNPDYLATHAVETAVSPDGATLLILTSGYNRNFDESGEVIPEESNEYVFVYGISAGTPVKKQAIPVPNAFNGLAWHPNRLEFYVTGGVDDNVHIYRWQGDAWVEDGQVPLGHEAGLGLNVAPMAAGIAVNKSGTQLLVANYENDSVSLVDIESRTKIAELDLRPGKHDPSRRGEPGGSYPFDVVFKDDTLAYVSSQRDRELVVIGVAGDRLALNGRINLKGQPNKLITDRAGSRLFAASDNSDSVVIVDTATQTIEEEISVTAPKPLFRNPKGFKGANPNNLALSPDEQTLFVTNGGLNALAVVQLARVVPPQGKRASKSRVIGLIPTGWYPNGVSVNPDGSVLYVVNGKSNAGPNPGACRDTLSIEPGALDPCRSRNLYVRQLHKAGFLSMPIPSPRELAQLTWQVAYNNHFPKFKEHEANEAMMAFLRRRIEHVIYIVKENRTYDQVLGDLEVGDGDPSLALLSPYSPNHQQLARQFVTLDNFYDSGETSGDGWNWSTAARATDFTEKTQPVNYAGRGLSYDWEGSNRNVTVALPTVEARQAVHPDYPDDPDLLAGTADVAAPDNPEGEAGAGYLWNAALRAGLTIRNYGFFVQNLGDSTTMDAEVLAHPHAHGVKQAVARKQALAPYTDEYFRGYDQNNADFYLFREWEREFDEFVARGNLPNLSFVRFPHDHFGNFSTAKFGVNTVETQMADNDYATALVVEKVVNSPFKDNTLIFIIEDDAQNGGDHVDAHRSVGYIIGPYVKQGAVISTHYTTVSLLRTIEEVLGIKPLGLNDGLAEPMADVFDRHQKDWDYRAIVPEVLYTTELPLPDSTTAKGSQTQLSACAEMPLRSAAYWDNAMGGQNFKEEDKLDTERFNRALWAGLKGEQAAYPSQRHGRDLRKDRGALLAQHQARRTQECAALIALSRSAAH